MRKSISESNGQTVPLTLKALELLEQKGFQYVQVKAFTSDRHFDYVEPSMFIMFPMKELPSDPLKKDIYEPINSELLKAWASEENEMTTFRISVIKN
jgi:hypothetical protein